MIKEIIKSLETFIEEVDTGHEVEWVELYYEESTILLKELTKTCRWKLQAGTSIGQHGAKLYHIPCNQNFIYTHDNDMSTYCHNCGGKININNKEKH